MRPYEIDLVILVIGLWYKYDAIVLACIYMVPVFPSSTRHQALFCPCRWPFFRGAASLVFGTISNDRFLVRVLIFAIRLLIKQRHSILNRAATSAFHGTATLST